MTRRNSLLHFGAAQLQPKLLLLLIALLGVAHGKSSVAPPQGPPASFAGPSLRFLDVSFTNTILKNLVEQELVKINQSLAARTDARATVRLVKDNVWGPRFADTQYTDRPNDRFIQIPHILELKIENIQWAITTYEVDVPCSTVPAPAGCGPGVQSVKVTRVGTWGSYPWTRNASISLEVNASCEGWADGSGDLKIRARADKPYLDPDPSLSEAIVNAFLVNWLIPFIDSKIRASLATPSGLMPTTVGQCNTIDRGLIGPDPVLDAQIRWNQPTFQMPPVTPSVSIRPLSIRRLRARDGNQILYEQVETTSLEFWAGNAAWNIALPPMREDDVVNLQHQPARLAVPRLPNGSMPLVVIANMPHGFESDSAFGVFTPASHYGHGIRKIIVKKTYSIPPAPPRRKPIYVDVDAYEVTFQVTDPSQTGAATFR